MLLGLTAAAAATTTTNAAIFFFQNVWIGDNYTDNLEQRNE